MEEIYVKRKLLTTLAVAILLALLLVAGTGCLSALLQYAVPEAEHVEVQEIDPVIEPPAEAPVIQSPDPPEDSIIVDDNSDLINMIVYSFADADDVVRELREHVTPSGFRSRGFLDNSDELRRTRNRGIPAEVVLTDYWIGDEHLSYTSTLLAVFEENSRRIQVRYPLDSLSADEVVDIFRQANAHADANPLLDSVKERYFAYRNNAGQSDFSDESMLDAIKNDVKFQLVFFRPALGNNDSGASVILLRDEGELYLIFNNFDMLKTGNTAPPAAVQPPKTVPPSASDTLGGRYVSYKRDYVTEEAHMPLIELYEETGKCYFQFNHYWTMAEYYGTFEYDAGYVYIAPNPASGPIHVEDSNARQYTVDEVRFRYSNGNLIFDESFSIGMTVKGDVFRYID